MATVAAKVKKGFPICPKCSFIHKGSPDDYGVDHKTGNYWFVFICPVCSVKKKGQPKYKTELRVKYFSDGNFKVIKEG
jgi:hypothetical protein